MNDLSGLSWSSNQTEAKKPPFSNSALHYPHALQSNNSGRSTPFSASSGPSNPSSKPATPANDSFANLVSFSSGNSTKNLTLLEQQKKLEGEKARKEAASKTQFEAHYGAQNAQFWDSLEHDSKRPVVSGAVSVQSNLHSQDDDDDLLAAFNASAPVDASTNFPVPAEQVAATRHDVRTSPYTFSKPPAMDKGDEGFIGLEDDDPFGLDQLRTKPVPMIQDPPNEDDFLGELSKPVSAFSRQEGHTESAFATTRPVQQSTPSKPTDEVDRALAELIDMGFPPERAQQALKTTSSGVDVQAAVSWLLTEAHAESRQKTRGRASREHHPVGHLEQSQGRQVRSDESFSSREDAGALRAPRSRSAKREANSVEREAIQSASAFGSNFLKAANSMWKTGSKKMQQVVNDLNSEHDPSQPRWMKDTSFNAQVDLDLRRQPHFDAEERAASNLEQKYANGLTDEALLLESNAGRPSRPTAHQRHEYSDNHHPLNSQPSSKLNTDRWAQQHSAIAQNSPLAADSRLYVSKATTSTQSAQAYISPARRKRPVAQPAPSQSQTNIDIFDTKSARPAEKSQQTLPSHLQTSSNALPMRPKAPSSRKVPEISQEVLASIRRQREMGAEAYKRGDYAAAHDAFTQALASTPDKHPIMIIICSNRAMTALKIGEPKSAIEDADRALDVIGTSRGEAEFIELGNNEIRKPMRDFFGKALMRKAEALEQLELWSDAAQAWKQAVETGHGGSTSIQGRNRCEKAAGISKKPAVSAGKTPAMRGPPSSRTGNANASAASTTTHYEAVNRLRAANKEAERLDEEKFNLAESVDARIAEWKGGKQDNLRALLASLDTILWPEAGWKKINMSELVLPNKVKVQYMKGIAKVHPDKVCSLLARLLACGSLFSLAHLVGSTLGKS